MSGKNEKYSFIVVKYPQKETAAAALAVVKQLAKEDIVKLKDVVAITKTEKGKIKLHQTADDSAGKGFLKGGVIGLIFAVLFGGAAWLVAGAALGTAFAMFDRGIKDKLLKELGEDMTSDESALAALIEEADWATLQERMAAQNFNGERVIMELVGAHLAEVEALAEKPEAIEAVESASEELELVKVTARNYVRAETDSQMKGYIEKTGCFGKFVHSRQAYDVNNQVTVRANRDTLYSFGVFDLRSPLTVTLPDPGDRYLSLMVVSQDHSIAVHYYPDEVTLTQENVGTRYVFLIFRTFMDPNSEEDITAAHQLQDQITIEQSESGSFEIPAWKQEEIE